MVLVESIALSEHADRMRERAHQRYVAALKAPVRKFDLPSIQINLARRRENVAGILASDGASSGIENEGGRGVPPSLRAAAPLSSRPGSFRGARSIIRRAEERLRSPDGRDALAWLRERGLADHTISRFRLGFIAPDETSDRLDSLADREKPWIWAPRGIAIPWAAPAAWYATSPQPSAPRWCGVVIRRLMPDVWTPWPASEKCIAVSGSSRGYGYPWADLTPGVPVLIVEGGIDALLAFRGIGHLVNVTTTGGASSRPRTSLRSALAGCPRWPIATDADDARDEASAAWRARGGDRCRRLLISAGKDIGDFVQAGGDLPAWLRSELARLGITP